MEKSNDIILADYFQHNIDYALLRRNYYDLFWSVTVALNLGFRAELVLLHDVFVIETVSLTPCGIYVNTFNISAHPNVKISIVDKVVK